MRVEQLEYIAAVTPLGSLRRAAEELHLSQPALSETVRNQVVDREYEPWDRERVVVDTARQSPPQSLAVLLRGLEPR
ncbi:hypothetical protein STRIP9103_00935 [Streptomyces ipomoeae 91-03]|uniref:HTH lysR-type domain-containing protein n=1 Tax=Streptomyces ipomoeae 91-03 TaxID=698759 RepID=L1KJV4_9ACTN|nr:hypothetical protein STRIP9103_00935 [Streptomyces ipomoeae 91-03]